MKNIVKSTLILVAITLIAGLSLAFVYQITKAPIADAEKKAREDAYRAVLPNVQGFIAEGNQYLEATFPVDMGNGVLINDCRTAVADVPETEAGTGIPYRIAGHVVNVTSKNGYGGEINLAVGIHRDGSVAGVSVISQSETPGLGAKCAEKKFTDQFIGIKDTVEYVKTGKTEPNEIDAISGATITTKAVTEAVNAARDYVLENYKEVE